MTASIIWGQAPEEIDPEIIRRVPVRRNYEMGVRNHLWRFRRSLWQKSPKVAQRHDDATLCPSLSLRERRIG